MKYFLIIITLIGIGFSQSFTVENVQAAQSTDGEHILTITYDLVSDGTYPSFMVHPEISIDGGETWNYLITTTVENVLGDNVFAGIGKTFSIDLDDYYTGMYTNNALVKIQALGREAMNLPSSFDNLFVSVESGEYMGGQATVHQLIGFAEEPTIKELNYTFEISKFHITNAQYAEFLIDVYQQNLISVRPYDWNSGSGSWVMGAFPGYGHLEPHLQEDCEYVYQSNWTEPNSYCNNGNVWIQFPKNNEVNWDNSSHIQFNGTTFIVEPGFGEHPVTGVTIQGAMVFAHYYGLRLVTMEELTKAGNGMNFYDYAWGDYPTYQSNNYSELAKYMNYNRGGGCDGFNNPWAPQDNYISQTTTPVGYFNGSTYYYPDGFTDRTTCDPIYEIQTENAISPYGLYDCNGNVWDWTSNYVTEGNATPAFAIMGGSGWDGTQYAQTTAAINGSGYGTYYYKNVGFRVARTINTTND